MRKVTPEKVAKINRMKRDGIPVTVIAAKLGLSVGSVSQAGKPQTKKAAAPVPEAERLPVKPVTGEPMSTEEVRTALSKLARGLVADAETARDAGEAARYQSHARQAMAAVSALAKLPLPPGEDLDGAIVVTEASIEAAAKRGRERLFEVFAKLHESVEHESEEAPSVVNG